MPNTGNTQQQINYGATANDGLGDPLRTAFIKVDENFDNIWLAGPVGSNITIGNNTIQVNNTNGNLVLQPNGVGVIQANASIVPSANNIRDLGSSSSRWRRAYIQNLNIANLEVPGQATIAGDAVIAGNLTVEGDTIQIGNIVTDTLTIQLANTAANGAQANGAGITVGANDDIATLLYNSADDRWVTNIGITTPDITVSSIASDDSSFVNIQDGLSVDGPIDAAGTVSAPYFVGNGSLLTGIATYGNADVAAYLPTYDGALAGQTLTITSAGGNVWSINDRTLSSPNGGTWYSNPDGVDGYLTSPIDGYLTIQSLYPGPGFNVASQVQLEHDFVRIKVINGGEEEWDFLGDGTLQTPGDVEVDGNLVANSAVVTENLEVTKAGNTWYWNGALMLTPAGGSWFSNPDVQEEFISSGEDGYLSLQALGAGPGFNIQSEVKLEHGMIRIGVYNGSNKEWDFNEDGTMDVPGDILPQANAAQSLGNVNLQWAELWVANNTIYLGGVALGVTGNVLTVDGQAVLANDSNTSISTTGNISANAILTDNYFYANGQPFVSGGSIGNLEVTGTTIGIAAGAPETDITVGNSSAGLSVQPDTNNPIVKLYANTTDSSFFNSGGDFSTGTYVAGGAGGVITLNDATTIEQYLNNLSGPYTIVSVTVNGTDTVPWDGGGWGGGTVTINTTVPPTVDPTNVTSIVYNLVYENKFLLDVDDGSFGIYIGDENFDIQSVRDVRIQAGDDFSIESDDGFDLRSRSTTGGIDLITDYGNSQQTWQFRYDGTLRTPGDITVAGDITGTSGASTLYLKAQPNSDTYIQLNNTVNSTINTVADLEISTDVSNTARTWRFDTNGDLTVPNYINFKDGTFIGDEGGAGTPVFRVDSPLGLGINLTTDSDISGNNYTWQFGIDGTLTAPGNITTTGNITGGNVITDGSVNVAGNVRLTSAEASDTARMFADVSGSNTSLVLEVGDDNADSIVLRHYSFSASNTIDMLTATRSSDTAANVSVTGNLAATGNITGTNLISSATIFGNVDLILGNIANASGAKTRITTFGANSYIQTGNGTVGSTGNIVFAPYLDSTEKVVINTATGNVTAQNFVGNISITGNVTGTSANVELVAGSYEWTFDDTGNLTLPGNTFAVNYADGTAVNPVTRFAGSWSVTPGTANYSFTVFGGHTYTMWVNGNIPNGIVVWNATATVTNTNVPVIGTQYAWYYPTGNALVLNSIPSQIIGTAGTISNTEPVVSNTNVFTFSITNNSGSTQVVNYGWIRIS